MTPAERAAIEARLATVPAWTLCPRDIYDCARVDAGADPLALAEAANPDAFLGWELEPPLDEADRGFTGPQAAQLVHLARDARTLLDALAEAEAERDELARTLANERGEGPPPSEGWIPDLHAHAFGEGLRFAGWSHPRLDAFVRRNGDGWRWVVRDGDAGSMATVYGVPARASERREGSSPTARAAMIAADAAGGDRG